MVQGLTDARSSSKSQEIKPMSTPLITNGPCCRQGSIRVWSMSWMGWMRWPRESGHRPRFRSGWWWPDLWYDIHIDQKHYKQRKSINQWFFDRGLFIYLFIYRIKGMGDKFLEYSFPFGSYPVKRLFDSDCKFYAYPSINRWVCTATMSEYSSCSITCFQKSKI